MLHEPGKHAVHLPWVRWAKPLLAQVPGTEILAGFADRQVRPGVLVPPPDVHMPALEEELETIRTSDPERVRRYFDNNGAPADRFQREFYDDPPAGLARLAGVLRQIFTVLVAPHWPRMLGVLEADIAYGRGCWPTTAWPRSSTTCTTTSAGRRANYGCTARESARPAGRLQLRK